jgi:hypothetical protein
MESYGISCKELLKNCVKVNFALNLIYAVNIVYVKTKIVILKRNRCRIYVFSLHYQHYTL